MSSSLMEPILDYNGIRYYRGHLAVLYEWGNERTVEMVVRVE